MSADQIAQTPPKLVVVARLASDTVEALLLSVGRGNKDAIHFDPHQNSAETWLLTCAHKHAIDGLDPAVHTNKEHP